MTTSDVLVIGRGVVGALAAWRAARTGRTVTCLDPAPGDGATHAAAGMIAPVTEAEFNERDLASLNVVAARAWPDFAAGLEAASGVDIGYRDTGILSVAFDADDARLLERLRDLQRSFDLPVDALTTAEARRREPLLGQRIAAASWAANDHQVDPRRLLLALDRCLGDAGVQTVRRAATALTLDGPDVVGAVDDAGEEHRAAIVVLAAGLGVPRLLRPLEDVEVPVRSVKGEILRLDAAHLPWLRGDRVVRGFVQGRPIYVVGRDTGEIVVGATSDERLDDRRATAGGVFALLRDARAVLPGLDEATLVEATARSRPATPDNVPAFGLTRRDGLIVAAGHYRHGVLLTSATAQGFDDLFAGRPLDAAWSCADPARFSIKEPV